MRAVIMPQSERGFYPRLFAIAGLVLLGWALFKIFVPFIASILWSALLAFLLDPLNLHLTKRLKGRKGLAAGILTGGATLAVIAPSVVLGIVFAGQAADLVARFGADARSYQVSRPEDLFRLPYIANALSWLEAHLPFSVEQMEQWAISGSHRAVQVLAGAGGNLVIGAMGLLVDVLLTLFLLFFFLRDGADQMRSLRRLIPMREDQKKLLADQMSSVTRAVVLGTLVTAIVQGALVGIGFAIVGFPSPVVFGVLAGALSLLPVGGTALVWGPGAIVLAAQGRWSWAIGLAVYGIFIVGMADNLLKPLLISGKADISTLPVFFGVIGGLSAFGFIGMFLGPIIVAFALALMRFIKVEPEAKA